MALSQLTDVIIPEVYETYTAVNSPEKTAFFESGVIVQNAALNAAANAGGETLNIPFWLDLDGSDEPNLSDDTENSATAAKVTAAKQIARVANLNQGYKAADLTGELAGSDPMQHVRNRFGTYWMRAHQRRIISACTGIYADNVANDSSDMVIDVASESIAGQSDSTLFNLNSFTDAGFTMGDNQGRLTSIAVHSAVAAQMTKNNDIVYIQDSEGRLVIPTYMGLRVVIDDGLNVTAGSTDGFKYTSVLFGQGALGYGEGTPAVPMELEREASEGNGGGTSSIWERKTWLLHPAGFATGTAPAGQSYTVAELALAATWDRVVDRKNVPMAFLVTN